MKVGASDNTSAITKIDVYINGPLDSGWKKTYTWQDNNATAKQLTKNFTVTNLDYNEYYHFYAEVFDKSGKSSTVSLFDVIDGTAEVTCDTSINNYGTFTLCPNQTMLHLPSNTLLTNKQVGAGGLSLQVNVSTTYTLFQVGEQKVVQGLGGTSIKVKFNGYDTQGNAFVVISQA